MGNEIFDSLVKIEYPEDFLHAVMEIVKEIGEEDKIYIIFHPNFYLMGKNKKLTRIPRMLSFNRCQILFRRNPDDHSGDIWAGFDFDEKSISINGVTGVFMYRNPKEAADIIWDQYYKRHPEESEE